MTRKFLICDGEAVREASPDELLRGATALISQRFRRGCPVLESPDLTRQYLRLHIGGLPYEVFGLLLLDTRHRLIRVETLFRGTIDGASVHPREVARVVLEANAAAVILFHNHPLCGVAVSPPRPRVTRSSFAPLSAGSIQAGCTVQ